MSDGAAAVLVGRRSAVEALGLPVLGVLRGSAVVGVPPDVMGIGPAYAIPAALKQAGEPTVICIEADFNFCPNPLTRSATLAAFLWVWSSEESKQRLSSRARCSSLSVFWRWNQMNGSISEVLQNICISDRLTFCLQV